MTRTVKLSDPELARLLSGKNEPSVLEKEAALESILAAVEAGPQRADLAERSRLFVKRWWLMMAAPAVAAAALLLTLLPKTESVSPRHQGGAPEWAARGGAVPAALKLRCVPPSGAGSIHAPPCQTNELLTLRVNPPPGKPYFAAIAIGSDDQLLWYLPAPGGKSERLIPDPSGMATASRAIPMSTHPRGNRQYRVHGVFSEAPLTRQALRTALGPQLEGRRHDIEVIVQELELSP